jgi:hypothetical protein
VEQQRAAAGGVHGASLVLHTQGGGRVRGGEGGGCKIWVLGIYDGEGLQLLEPKPTFHTPDSVS